MRVDFVVVLDACVLLPMPLADTLLRMAERPRLYIPRWSAEIIDEVSRNLTSRLNKTPDQAKHREKELRQAFPSAWVDDGYKLLSEAMQNNPKDRHVLAAAVGSAADTIVTYNQEHFPDAALSFFGITPSGPSAFLKDLYDIDPPIATRKLVEQAENLQIPLEGLLARMGKLVPSFVDFVCEELQIDIRS